MPARYKPYNEIRSGEEMRKAYLQAVEEVYSLRKTSKSDIQVARDYRHERDELRVTVKKSKGRIVQLTKKQKASEEAAKSGMWSGAAAVSVTILYEIWKVVGFPGGYEWKDFWSHEAPHAVIMWLFTLMFGWFYKASRPH